MRARAALRWARHRLRCALWPYTPTRGNGRSARVERHIKAALRRDRGDLTTYRIMGRR